MDLWSPMSCSFIEYAERNVDCRTRASFSNILQDNPLPAMSPQPWPLFLEAEAAGELERISVGLDRLVKSVPERYFRNDPARLAAFYGSATREVMELVILEPTGISQAISRGDFLDTAEGLQCIELNSGSYVGGWQLQALEGLYRENPVISRFLAERNLRASHRNTIRLMFRHILRETLQKGVWKGGALNLATIIHPQRHPIEITTHPPELYNREYRAALAEERPDLDGQVFLCAYADLVEDRGGLTYRGERVHAVLEQHTGQCDPRVFRHFKMGKVNLFSGPVTGLISDKRNLALLSENAASEDFTAAERDLLQRHLPWTRLVADTETTWRGQRVRLPELLAASRERFVLKKGLSLGGRDVHLGSFTSPEDWEELLRQALARTGWTVQELVESRPCLFLDTDDRVVQHNLVWGLFNFGNTFGGIFLRVQPTGRGGVVNTARGAEVSPLLEVEPAI